MDLQFNVRERTRNELGKKTKKRETIDDVMAIKYNK